MPAPIHTASAVRVVHPGCWNAVESFGFGQLLQVFTTARRVLLLPKCTTLKPYHSTRWNALPRPPIHRAWCRAVPSGPTPSFPLPASGDSRRSHASCLVLPGRGRSGTSCGPPSPAPSRPLPPNFTVPSVTSPLISPLSLAAKHKEQKRRGAAGRGGARGGGRRRRA